MPRPRPPFHSSPPASEAPTVLSRLAGFLQAFRWIFMPLGLCALIAVGVHAAADTIDDRLLWLVDRVDSVFDGIVGAWSVTEPWVHLIGFEQRVTIARFCALLWELSADAILAIPALGWFERSAPAAPEAVRAARRHLSTLRPARSLWARLLARPTALAIVRPLATGAVCLAGACAVARMVQGALYLGGREVFGDGLASGLARVLAVSALLGVMVAMGGRAVLRNLESAQQAFEDEGVRARGAALWVGLPGSALVVPLAVAALLDASPVLSFFR